MVVVVLGSACYWLVLPVPVLWVRTARSTLVVFEGRVHSVGPREPQLVLHLEFWRLDPDLTCAVTYAVPRGVCPFLCSIPPKMFASGYVPHNGQHFTGTW